MHTYVCILYVYIYICKWIYIYIYCIFIYYIYNIYIYFDPKHYSQNIDRTQPGNTTSHRSGQSFPSRTMWFASPLWAWRTCAKGCNWGKGLVFTNTVPPNFAKFLFEVFSPKLFHRFVDWLATDVHPKNGIGERKGLQVRLKTLCPFSSRQNPNAHWMELPDICFDKQRHYIHILKPYDI